VEPGCFCCSTAGDETKKTRDELDCLLREVGVVLALDSASTIILLYFFHLLLAESHIAVSIRYESCVADNADRHKCGINNISRYNFRRKQQRMKGHDGSCLKNFFHSPELYFSHLSITLHYQFIGARGSVVD
jgi:hypothetical protein